MDFGLVITSIQSAIDSVSAVQSNAVLRERLAFIYEQMDVLQKPMLLPRKNWPRQI